MLTVLDEYAQIHINLTSLSCSKFRSKILLRRHPQNSQNHRSEITYSITKIYCDKLAIHGAKKFSFGDLIWEIKRKVAPKQDEGMT